jgi:protein-disulfide isomerase
MTRRLLSLSLATSLALTLSACGGGGESGGGATPSAEPAANVAAPEGQSWSQVVSATDAGFIMGNPDAPIKLVEYASPTCGHCAAFSVASSEVLKNEMINSGRVSLELRPFMLNPADVVLATVAACAGPDRFFPLMENMYSSHDELVGALQGADQTAAQAAMQAAPAERMAALGRAMGLDQFFAARGVTPADYNRCLADPAAPERWARLTATHSSEGEVTGTPSFDLNGERITLPPGVEPWDHVREQLQAAGAR